MRFREHYTELVEHFFRMAVRHIEVTKKTPLDWFKFTWNWIDKQSEEDKKFIEKVNTHFESMQHEMQHDEKKA